MATVTIVLRNDKVNKKNEAPIHFRIIKNRKVSYIASGILIPVENWDNKKNRIKGRHTNSARLNSFLANKFTELQDQVFEHETISKSLTTRQLKDKIYGKKPTEIIPFAEATLQNYLKANQIGTYQKNLSVLNKLKAYVKSPNITFSDIDLNYLIEYEKHLRDHYKNGTNTVLKDFKFLRKLFKDALRADLIEYSQDPFLKYQMRSEKTQRNYLTEDELSSLEAVKTNPGSKCQTHQDMFIFSAYVGGLRVSDTLKLRWCEFDGTHINITIEKTKSQISILVPNKAIHIINKYRPEIENPESFIFQCLPPDLDTNDPVALHRCTCNATNYINKDLELLRKKAEITKKITFHIARHTWATRALRKGISIDKVSKLMGHSEIKVTQIYAKIISSELDKAMLVFND